MVFSCEKILLYFVILSLILLSMILYKNLLNLLESFVSTHICNICLYPSNYPFIPRAGIDDINFDILIFLQWGEKNIKTKFLEATLCVKWETWQQLSSWRSEQKFCVPKMMILGSAKASSVNFCCLEACVKSLWTMVGMLLRKNGKPESTLIAISLLNHCIDHLKPVVKLIGNMCTHRYYLWKCLHAYLYRKQPYWIQC